MTNPLPPIPGNEGAPLYQGIDPEWNDVVRYIPEDKRAEFAPVFNGKVSSLREDSKNYEAWKPFAESNVTPDYAQQALLVMEAIENRPQDVYKALQTHLGMTAQQAQQVVEQVQEQQEEQPEYDITAHPAFKQVQQQLDAAAKILLANREAEEMRMSDAQADAELDQELKALEAKVGKYPEREIHMRMHSFGMSAEQAYADYMESSKSSKQFTPSPLLMGGGGPIPTQRIDVTKLDNKGTKDLVAELLSHVDNQ